MSELDRAIKNWRCSLRGINDAQRDELESHLREQVAALMGQGIDREQAFGEAAVALGLPTQLRVEYGKAGGPLRRRVLGLTLWTLVMWCVYRIGFFIPMPGVDQTLVQQWLQGPLPIEWYLFIHSPVTLLHGPALFVLLWLAGVFMIYRYTSRHRASRAGIKPCKT